MYVTGSAVHEPRSGNVAASSASPDQQHRDDYHGIIPAIAIATSTTTM